MPQQVQQYDKILFLRPNRDNREDAYQYNEEDGRNAPTGQTSLRSPSLQGSQRERRPVFLQANVV